MYHHGRAHFVLCAPTRNAWQALASVFSHSGWHVDALVQVCKATAAAMLDPEATQQAVLRQAQLQPLKFAHFERRALHMATQLLECSRR